MLKWLPLFLFALALTIALAWGIRACRFSMDEDRIAARPENPDIKAEEVSPGWWESRQLIYYGIPARVLVHLPGVPPREALSLTRKAWDEFFRIGDIVNPFSPGSEVARLNALRLTGEVEVSDDLYSLFLLSDRLWRESGGLFDPTMMPIKRLWQEAEKKQVLPSEKQIGSILEKTGFDNVRIADGRLSLDHPGIMFDFGGIAKGYAVDRVREQLVQNGAAAGIIQLGGEVAAFGENRGKPWRIGIQHPRETDGIYGVVSRQGVLRVSTSGNYRQPITIQGYPFYHIFSPETGKPVPEKILGVTTLTTDPAISNAVLDGAATAIVVAGPAGGIALAEKLGIEALILYEGENGAVAESMTQGFAEYYSR